MAIFYDRQFSRARELYKKYLKGVFLFRWIAARVWKADRCLRIFVERWRPLISMAEYRESTRLEVVSLAEPTKISTQHPAFFPGELGQKIEFSKGREEFPAVIAVVMSKAKVYGASNLVEIKEGIVCHDLYDWPRDYTSEELHERAAVDVVARRMKWVPTKVVAEVPVAAAFLDSNASNYAHWMTEVLPKVALFCRVQELVHIPLVVNADLHSNILESLRMVAGPDRKIIQLEASDSMSIEKLYWVSPAGYVPFQPRRQNLTGYDHGSFSAPALHALIEKVAVLPAQSSGASEKIFIRRNSAYRNLLNAHEIEEALSLQGFVTVQPEKMSFKEQCDLFGKAQIIVGAIGASFANLIFCKSTAKIVILTTYNKDMLYCYWQNIADSASGLQVNYVLGDSIGESVHSDFKVDVNDVLDSMKW